MTPDEVHELNQRYRAKRRRWAWKVGRPYSQDIDKPPPGERDAQDGENG